MRLLGAALLAFFVVAPVQASSSVMRVKVLMSQKSTMGIDVDLIRLDESGRSLGILSGKTDRKGMAQFRTESQDYSVIARAHFQNVTYYSDMVLVGYPSPLEINVYPSTREPLPLEIEDVRLFVQSHEEGIMVSQQFIVLNPSDKTFLGSGTEESSETLRFSVPSSAFDLERGVGVNADSSRIENNDIIVSTPLVPGRTTFGLSYKMEKKRGRVQFKQALGIPAKQISIGIADAGVKPSFADLATRHEKFFDGKVISTFEWVLPQSAAKQLDFQISGLPLEVRFSHWLPFALLLVLLGLVTLFLKRAPIAQDQSLDRSQLLRELKSLERIKSQRLIEDSEYQLRRILLIEKLWSLDARS